MRKSKITTQPIDTVALTISLIYLSFGLAWINFSDLMVYSLFADVSPVALTELQTYKGFFYIGVTAIILYILIRHFQLKSDNLQQQLNAQNQVLTFLRGTLPFPVATLDVDGNFQSANNDFKQQLGINTKLDMPNVLDITINNQPVVTKAEWNKMLSGSQHDLIKKIQLSAGSSPNQLTTFSLHPHRNQAFEVDHIWVFIS